MPANAMNATGYEPVTPDTSVAVRQRERESGSCLPLSGLRICHLSPQQGRRDPRAYVRQSLPLVAQGVRPTIIGAHDPTPGAGDVTILSMPKAKSRFWRILTASMAVWKAAQQRADIYHVHSPENIFGALVLRHIFRRRVVYDTREDFPAMMLTKEYLPRRLRTTFRNLTVAAEKWAAWSLDGFVTADPGTLRNYANTGKSKKLVYYNFPNLSFFPETEADGPKKFDLVYRGGLSERAGTLVLFRAVAMLRDRGIRVSLHVFGYTDNGRSAEQIRNVIADLGIGEQVALGGVIPHSQMAHTLSQARVAVSPLLKIPKFMNNIPVKVFESWACGLPVIASDLPPIRPFFPRNQRHLLTRPGDSEELASKIETLLSRPERVREFGCQAKRLVRERYNSSLEARKLLRFYLEVLQGSTNAGQPAF